MSLAKRESLAFPAKGAPRDPKAKGGRRASRAPPVPPDPRGPRALPETTVPKAAPALSVFPEILVPPENLAPRVKTVLLATKETTVNPGKRDHQALRVSQAHLGLQEKGVRPAPQAPKAGKGRKEPREKPAWKALLGRLAPSAPRGPLGSRGLTAFEGSPAQWVNKVSPEPRAPMAPQDPWAPQDSPASKETLDPKEKRVTQA